MRSEHTFLLVLLLIAALVYVLSTGASGDNPTPDDEPRQQTTPETSTSDFVLLKEKSA